MRGIRRRIRNSRRMRASYARRQEWRRLRKAPSRGAGAAVAILAAVPSASANQAVLAILLVLVAGVLTLASRHALRLARRSRVGAVSEAQVRRAHKPLTRVDWEVRHALEWAGAAATSTTWSALRPGWDS